MSTKGKLKFYKRKRDRLKILIDKVERQIESLTTKMYGDSSYRRQVKNKYCIVCANRIAEHDFKIPDGIVCGHPSNQNGKDKFQCYSHTCKYWEKEKRLNISRDSEPDEPQMQVGTLVRWNEYPDRLYFIKEDKRMFTGHMCYKIETIDHKYVALVPEKDLTIDE